MKIPTAAAVLFVLVLLTICTVSVIAIPDTPADACEYSLKDGVHSDVYGWRGPDGYNITELQISEDDYRNSFQRNTVRHSSFYVSSPTSFIEPDNQCVKQIASGIEALGDSDYQRASYALSFVQSLHYYSDEQLYGQDEFWAYPIETLYQHGGDCEDLSVLLCSILLAMDIDCVLLDFEGHVSAGACVGGQGAYYSLDGKRYYVCEPTGTGPIGSDSPRENPVIRVPGADPLVPTLILGAVSFSRTAVQQILRI